MLRHIPFYASLIGKELLDGGKSTAGMVLVYGAIEAHAMGDKGCIASNKTIADECGLKEATVAVFVSVLNKNGWIKVLLDSNNHRKRIYPLMEIKPPFNVHKTPLLSTLNIDNSNKNTVIDKLSNDSVEIQRIYDLYIEKYNRNPSHYKLTDRRRQKIRARLKDAGYEMLSKAIISAAADPFYSGGNDRGWKADLDYITRSYEVVERLSQLEEQTKVVEFKL